MEVVFLIYPFFGRLTVRRIAEVESYPMWCPWSPVGPVL
jgi:hypothetical protein